MKKTEKIRELFRRKGVILCMGAHDGLSAKLAQDAGFNAVWASGLEISTSRCVPDANILTMTDFLDVASSMNESIDIPIVADCDTGFGNSNNVIHMVKKYEAAGISAVCIEDKHFPKVNSFIPGRQELATISEFVGKMLAAKNSQIDPDFMVIARVEALIAGWGMDEALKRANAYADAGADAILIHSKCADISEISAFTKRWKDRVPLVAVPTTYYKVKTSVLEDLGVKMVIYANHGIRTSIKSMRETFSRIISTGSSEAVESKIASMNDVFELQGMHKMKESELIYSGSDREKIVAIIPAAGDHLEEYSMKAISSDVPITMLDINGKPLLQRQVEVLNRCRVYDIRVVAGYKKEKITVDGIKIVPNERYKDTGILYSVMQAMRSIEQRVFITYGDTVFDHIIFEKMTESQKDITILVDKTYMAKDYGPDKKIDLLTTGFTNTKRRRVLHADALRRVARIGAGVSSGQDEYEFTGMTFLSQKGVKIFKDIYNKHKNRLRKAGLADMLNEIIKSGIDVYCLEADTGWMEIHSLDDYKAACSFLK